MGFAATEVGLEVDDWIAAVTAKATSGSNEELAQPIGQVGPAEERHRVLVLDIGVVGRHLIEVRGELCLLEATGRHVGMRGDDIAPRAQSRQRCALGGLGCCLPALASSLLVEELTLKITLESLDHLDLVHRTDGLQQALCSVEHSVGIVCRELVLVCPLVSSITELAGERSLTLAELVSPHLLPGVLHALEQERQVAWIRSS